MKAPPLHGLRLTESWHVQRGTALDIAGQGVFLHPSDMMVLRLGYRPFYSRYTAGAREADRDRRRRQP